LGHGRQADWPTAGWNEPAAHCKHEPALARGWKRPAGHFSTDAAPVAFVQRPSADEAHEPAGASVHALPPPAAPVSRHKAPPLLPLLPLLPLPLLLPPPTQSRVE